MDERLNDGPEENQKAAQRWNGTKNSKNDPGNNIKYHPHAAKDDRLHRVKANEIVEFLQEAKNEPPHQRNAGQRCGDIGR